jgi:hypothetical protein
VQLTVSLSCCTKVITLFSGIEEFEFFPPDQHVLMNVKINVDQIGSDVLRTFASVLSKHACRLRCRCKRRRRNDFVTFCVMRSPSQ